MAETDQYLPLLLGMKCDLLRLKLLCQLLDGIEGRLVNDEVRHALVVRDFAVDLDALFTHRSPRICAWLLLTISKTLKRAICSVRLSGGTEKALRGALGYRRPDVVGHGAEIDRQPSEKFAFVDVGGQLTDEVAILRLVEQLLELSAQVFHSVDHAPLLKKSPTSN
jgi:hypothetical protein